MKIKKTESPDLLTGRKKFIFSGQDSEQKPNIVFEATERGVEINGCILISDGAELKEFAKILSDVWKSHQKLLRDLTAELYLNDKGH